MVIRHLLVCQVHDPGRGEFYVHAVPVKKPNGTLKRVRGRQVYRGSHHAVRTAKGTTLYPHPEAHEFTMRAQ